MKNTIRAFCNFFIIIIAVIAFIYVYCFTDIPPRVGNVVKLKIEENKTNYVTYDENFNINKLTINMNSYYYNKLTDDEKKIYSSIANAVKNYESEFAIRDYSPIDKDSFASEVSVAITAFINDHPEVFYLDTSYSSYVLSGLKSNIGYIKLTYTEDSIDAVNNKIEEMDKVINEYASLGEGKTDFEKELVIHDALSKDLTYSNLDNLPRMYHTAEGPFLDKTGVCDGFSKALQLIYDRVGLDSIIVLGSLDGEPHAWNMVNIDGKWYHVDITSSKSVFDDTGIVNHAYFNLNTERVKKVCTIDDESLLPESTSLEYNYYIYNNYIVYSQENVQSKLSDIYKDFEDKNYIEFYLEGNVSDRITSVLVALRRIDTSFFTNSKMYYYNIQNGIVIPKN